LNSLNPPCKQVSKSKMGFFKMDTSVKINQGSGPSRVRSQQIIALYIVSANKP
jgi:hypothetical protein